MPKPGEKVRADCHSCDTEFEVTLEPKAAVAGAANIPTQRVQFCPFCGANEGSLDADEDE